jgi:hypothetical protein
VLESLAAEFGDADSEKQMSVTYDKRWVAGGRNPKYGHGSLRMYVCRGCGYVQWFADAPDEIPVGAEYSTRVIKGPSPGGPFR